ncbi:MAG: acireductone synthase [Pirellulaceae bacterium]|nr:acireductone synthase [Pirellulaceae bacterium]
MTPANAASVSLNGGPLLLDIEGTVSPVAFVYDVMFPFIRDNVAGFLDDHWDEDKVKSVVALVAKDMGHDDVTQWLGSGPASEQRRLVVQAVLELMDRDAKVTGLKQLQGLVWKAGFDGGQLVAELFPDVLPKLRECQAAGIPLYIYSSGSIGAQKLFFGHTTEGDLLGMFDGHFDTTSGGKKEVESYRSIAANMGFAASKICFVSDVIAELDAAREAGMQTVLRTAEQDEGSDHSQLVSFQQLAIS